MLTLLVPFAEFDDAAVASHSHRSCVACAQNAIIRTSMRTWLTERKPAIPPPITMMMMLSNTELKSSGDIFCAESQCFSRWYLQAREIRMQSGLQEGSLRHQAGQKMMDAISTDCLETLYVMMM